PVGAARRPYLFALRFRFGALLLLWSLAALFLLLRGLLPALLRLEEQKILAVAFLLQFLHRDEAQGGGITAVTLPGGGRTSVENVAEMRVACFPANLGALHAVRTITFLGHVL